MIWENPTILWLLFIVALLPAAGWFWSKRRDKQRERFFSKELYATLTNERWKPGARIRNICVYAGLALMVVGLAGPRIGSEIREITRQGIDLVVILDVSKSMHAEDIRPNRLEKAKFEIERIVNRLQGDRIGLILFTGQAFVQCPLTTDYSAFRMYLDLASTDQLPSTTTTFSVAFDQAHQLFRDIGADGRDAARVVLMFSDGEDHGPDFDSSLNALVRDGIYVSTVGIGTRQGAMIPMYDSRTGELLKYKRDRQDRVVTTRLEPETLRHIADRGRGTYYEISRTNDRVDGFISKIEELERTEFATETFSDYRNRYQYPVAAGLLLLVIGYFTPVYKPAKIK